MRRHLIVLLLVGTTGSACADRKLEARVAELEQQSKEMADQLAQQQKDLASARMDLWLMEGNEASVSTTDPGYDIAKSKLGVFTISTEKAERYLDGYKLTLVIGNVTSAKFDNVKLKVRWATTNPQGGAIAPAAQGAPALTFQEKTVRLTESLQPGSWNKVQVVLSPASAEEIKRVLVSIETDRIGLRDRQ